MKSSDILKIIESAKGSGLTYIKLGDMELRFRSGDAEETRLVGHETPTPQTILVPQEVESEIKEQTLDKLEDDLQSLQIDDPLRFEELLSERELELGEESKD